MKFGKKEIHIISFCVLIFLICVVCIISISKKNNIKFSLGEVGEPYKYMTNSSEYNTMVVEDVVTSTDYVSIQITADKNTFIDFLRINGFSILDKNDKPIDVELISINDLENGNGNIEVVTKILDNKEARSIAFTKLNNQKYTKFNLR